MTRQEAINRWKDIVSTVFWAEEAIATEIVSRKTDEELSKMESL